MSTDTLSLKEILALDCFYSYHINKAKTFLSLEIIVDWAERQVISGDTSESLLILASLGLDNRIEAYEVDLYLERYLAEKNIDRPSINYSHFIFLRLLFDRILSANTLDDISLWISEIAHRWYDLNNQHFHNIVRYWEYAYYNYFDYYLDLYEMNGDEQYSAEQRYRDLKQLAKRFCDLLNNEDMLAILVK